MTHLEFIKNEIGVNEAEIAALLNELDEDLGFGLSIRAPLMENSYILRDGDGVEITLPREMIQALLTYINAMEVEHA